VTVIRNHAAGYAWTRAVPDGYELSVLGAIIFALGGVGDLLWHQIFGIELGIEATVSPSHLTLALGAVLMVSGPLRAAWRRSGDGAASWDELAPALLSLTYTLAVFTVITQWASPFVQVWAGRDSIDTPYTQMLGIVSIVLQSGLLIGFALLALRRWRLPFGAMTLVFTLTTVLLTFMHDQFRFIPVAIAAGLVADLLVASLRPSVERPNALRLFAFTAPLVLYALYFLAIALTEGIAWTIELWAGSTVFAGITGLLLSYLLAPPIIHENAS
jgi:hypothetical protein